MHYIRALSPTRTGLGQTEVSESLHDSERRNVSPEFPLGNPVERSTLFVLRIGDPQFPFLGLPPREGQPGGLDAPGWVENRLAILLRVTCEILGFPQEKGGRQGPFLSSCPEDRPRETRVV